MSARIHDVPAPPRLLPMRTSPLSRFGLLFPLEPPPPTVLPRPLSLLLARLARHRRPPPEPALGDPAISIAAFDASSVAAAVVACPPRPPPSRPPPEPAAPNSLGGRLPFMGHEGWSLSRRARWMRHRGEQPRAREHASSLDSMTGARTRELPGLGATRNGGRAERVKQKRRCRRQEAWPSGRRAPDEPERPPTVGGGPPRGVRAGIRRGVGPARRRARRRCRG